ncbi:hypothetical protein HGA34_03880 [Candidatus Falkowbacteria bacterium]|nr:hypothetical protein [Candidatus Falkowbacteria bacterium]
MNKENKKKIIIGSAISVLLILVAVAYYFNSRSEGETVTPRSSTSTQPVSVANAKPAAKRPMQMAEAKQPSLDSCAKSDEASRKSCVNQYYSSQAFLEEDTRICLKVDDYTLRNQCLYNRLTPLKKPDECRRIADANFRDRCQEDIGMSVQGADYCDKFDDEPSEKQECVDRVTAIEASKRGDIQACAGIKTLEYGFLCEINAMKQKGNVCEEISDVKKRNLCISRVQFSRAKDKADCDKLPDETYRRVCNNILGVSLDDKTPFDSDSDGLNDYRELWISTDPFNPDTDSDGLNDDAEYNVNFTDPIDPDSDDDGLKDGEEVAKGTNPKMPNRPGTVNKVDTDEDGLLNSDEVKWGTNAVNSDTDGDGVMDGAEIGNGTDPLGPGWQQDADRDGLIDADEIFYLTNPLKADTDSDGTKDGEEIKMGKNPLGKGQMDFDLDGLTDADEAKYGTRPGLKDTNSDGIDDSESIRKKVNPTSNDSDGDKLSNSFEIKSKTNPFNKDTDKDGLNDFDEVEKYHSNPLKADTDGDGFTDANEVSKGFNPLSKINKK